jgi:tetratricopeptide (TPR) repeat protein
VYGDAFFKNYQAILNSDANSINDTFNKYNINTVILSEAGGNLDNLSGYFFNKKEWALVYFNTDALIFLKDTPQNKLIISRLKLDLKKWITKKTQLNEIGLKRVYPDPYINRGWKFYYFGLYEQALDESREALRILPSASDAYNIMGRVYLKQKLYNRAFQALRLAGIYGPLDTQTLVSLGDFYTQTDKIDEAIKIYKKLTKLNPDFAEGYYLLGRAYSKRNDAKLAISSLSRAVKLAPFSTRYSKKLDELLKK